MRAGSAFLPRPQYEHFGARNTITKSRLTIMVNSHITIYFQKQMVLLVKTTNSLYLIIVLVQIYDSPILKLSKYR